MSVQSDFAILPLATISSNVGLFTNTLVADANGEELAIKYWPTTTSPISAIDVGVDITGTGVNWRLRVESDSADAPSGTILGTATPEFTISGDGMTGLQTLAANTGNLTINVPVWLILYRSSGDDLAAGVDQVAFRGLSANSLAGGFCRVRLYTGGNWSTTPTTSRLSYAVQHADNSYDGIPFTGVIAVPTIATDIYGNYRHGLRIKSGSKIKIPVVYWYAIKAGSPNSLIVAVFEGASLKYSDEVPAASIITGIPMPIRFTSPVLLAADTNIYIVLGQEDDANDGTLGDDGGDDSNDYDSRVVTFSSTYRSAVLPTDFAFVYGTGNDPTAYSVSDTDLPFIVPVIVDPAADLDQAAAGGINVECHNVMIQQGFGVVPY